MGSTTSIEPEFADIYTQWKSAPGPDTNAAFLKTLTPVIDSGIFTYGGGAMAGPSVRSQAKSIVLDALPKYDAKSGRLKPFLMSHLRGLQRAAGKETELIHIPERTKLERNSLMQAEAELTDSLSRPPADSELSDYMGLPLKRIQQIRKYHSPAVGATYEGMPTVGTSETEDSGWQKFVYYSLTPIDQLIMEHTRGWNGKPVLGTNELAKRLKITPAAISQRKAKIQAMIDEEQRDGRGNQ